MMKSSTAMFWDLPPIKPLNLAPKAVDYCFLLEDLSINGCCGEIELNLKVSELFGSNHNRLLPSM